MPKASDHFPGVLQARTAMRVDTAAPGLRVREMSLMPLGLASTEVLVATFDRPTTILDGVIFPGHSGAVSSCL